MTTLENASIDGGQSIDTKLQETNKLYQNTSYVSFDFPQIPQTLYHVSKEYSDNDKKCDNGNFLNGVKWSPDGCCILSSSDDNYFRIFDLPQTSREDSPLCDGFDPNLALRDDNLCPGLRLHSGETVYDYCWYTGMTAADPLTCCFFSTSRGHPIHLWDVCGSGGLRCSYRGYDAADELCAARSLASSPDGRTLAAGYDRAVLLFDVNRPGRDSRRIDLKRTRLIKRRRGAGGGGGGANRNSNACNGVVGSSDNYTPGITGIVSCLSYTSSLAQSSYSSSPLIAAGGFCSSIALIDPREAAPTAVLSGGHTGGLTQLAFSVDGTFLFSAARQDPRILCYDVRRLDGSVLLEMERDTKGMNQRIQFHVDPHLGRYLVSGGRGGRVRVFDLREGEGTAVKVIDDIRVRGGGGAEDGEAVVNGVAFHPSMELLATASGERKYSLQKHRKLRREYQELKEVEDKKMRHLNSLAIFKMKYHLQRYEEVGESAECGQPETNA
mmetsp:Transcript_18645/g.33869  ORF Transcript_18645/g.33869 Transcript_18645/m.33869 type:complete len:496 (-) Transcript_18645:100-1587(-)